MLSDKKIEAQLKKVGCNYLFWGSSEVAELSKLLMDNEEIAIAVNGYYEGGFGLLVATNYRVLIIDKKPFVLNLEDLRYDMITEVTYGARLIIARVSIAIPTRTIHFDSWSMEKLHKAMRHIQQHVLEARSNSTEAKEDWFKTRGVEYHTRLTNVSPADRIARVAHSALLAFDEIKKDVHPNIGHSSSQQAVNPYTRNMNAALRRRLPAFYN